MLLLHASAVAAVAAVAVASAAAAAMISSGTALYHSSTGASESSWTLWAQRTQRACVACSQPASW